MKYNQWTVGLAAAGVISLGSFALGEESPGHVLTNLSQTRLGGYVDTSAIWKFGSGNGTIPGRSFDGAAKQDGFNFNVAKVSLSKPLDEGNWAAGYHLDLLFGPDANGYNVSTGGGSFGSATSDFGVKQAYVAVRTPVGNGIDWKMGTFDSIIGYEVFESPNNPNYSRSYAWGLEPTQHTGLLATYQVSEMVSVAGGVANTAIAGINRRPVKGPPQGAFANSTESMKTYMGAITLELPEDYGFLGGSALYAGIVHGMGDNTQPFGPFALESNQQWYYAGATFTTPVTGLTVGLAYDYRTGTVIDGTPIIGTGVRPSDSYASAYGLYIGYEFTPEFTINARAEYVAASAGMISGGLRPVAGVNNDEYIGVTVTADYRLWANVISRLEFRWDGDITGGPVESINNPPAPNSDPDLNAISLALNLIYQF
jgi:hypothetical protein